MTITDKIIAIRTERRIKPSEIAAALDMLHSNYVRFEKKDKDFTIKQLEQIAAVLGVTLDDLLHYGEPANSGVNVGALEMEIKELKRELDLVKRELVITQKELFLSKQKTTKKYNGKWLKATDKEIGLFIEKDSIINKNSVNFYFSMERSFPLTYGELANAVFRTEIDTFKEETLYSFFTEDFAHACYERFFYLEGKGVPEFDTFTKKTKQEITEIFDYCYRKYIDAYVESFKNRGEIALLIDAGLLDMEGFADKWRYATSLPNFRIILNEYILHYLGDVEGVIKDKQQYRYFGND